MSQFVHQTGMDEDIIINSIAHQEDQILSIRREMKGIHASISDIEKRVSRNRLAMIGVGIVLVIFAVWIWLS
jgi:hypothetical protein